jgi:hypothetical protein
VPTLNLKINNPRRTQEVETITLKAMERKREIGREGTETEGGLDAKATTRMDPSRLRKTHLRIIHNLLEDQGAETGMRNLTVTARKRRTKRTRLQMSLKPLNKMRSQLCLKNRLAIDNKMLKEALS